MNSKVILAVAFTVSLLAACTSTTDNRAESSTEVEQQSSTDSHDAQAGPSAPVLPQFTLQNVSGEAVNLQSFKGKKVFVNLWATWCPPCRAEMPSIQRLFKQVDPNKVAFVMVSLDDDFDKAKSYVQKKKLDLPLYYPGENLPELFNVQGIPATFIFNEKGELILRIDGGEEYDTDKYRRLLK